MHPAELRKKLKPLASRQSSDNSSLDSFRKKIDVNVRTKRRGTMFPGAALIKREKPLEFKDAAQLPEVGLETIAEEVKQRAAKLAAKKTRNTVETNANRTVKIISAPLTPMPSSEDSASIGIPTPKREAVEEIQRANDLLKKFDAIQTRIKQNLENIRNQERMRFIVEQKEQEALDVDECCCTSSSVSTNVVVQKIMQEIARNRALHPEIVMTGGDVKQLRTEIGQYKNILKYVEGVDEAVEKTERVMMTPNSCVQDCAVEKCGKKETTTQREGKKNKVLHFVVVYLFVYFCFRCKSYR